MDLIDTSVLVPFVGEGVVAHIIVSRSLYRLEQRGLVEVELRDGFVVYRRTERGRVLAERMLNDMRFSFASTFSSMHFNT